MRSSEQIKGQSCSTGMWTKPQGGGEAKGDGLLGTRPGGVGLCWDPSQLEWEHHRVQDLGGREVMLPAGWSKAAVSRLQGKGTRNKCSVGSYLDPIQVGREGTLGAEC